MSSSRRRFLSYGLALPSLAWGCRPSGASVPPTASPEPTPPADPVAEAAPVKRLLVLGGTVFLGPAVVDEALAAGLEVTLFNRGKSNPDAYPDLETLIGDRDPKVGAGLSALEGRTWDAVIDTSGYFPRHVRASAELLAPSVGQYIFISSVSAYATHDHPGADETAALATLDDPTVETMGPMYQNYGGLKVLCEQAAEAAMPGQVANVRPGYIVGPNDPTDRFTYWPVRVAQGGDVLAPGSPDDPLQVIDVRDLGRWLVHLVTSRTMGVFNAVGPAQPMNWGTVLAACKKASDNDAKYVWASTEFLEAQRERMREQAEQDEEQDQEQDQGQQTQGKGKKAKGKKAKGKKAKGKKAKGNKAKGNKAKDNKAKDNKAKDDKAKGDETKGDETKDDKDQGNKKSPPPLRIPIWAPPTGETAGFHRYSNARAVEAGLTCRSIEQTTADTLEWFRSLPQERRNRLESRIPSEQEETLLAELAKIARAPGLSLPARPPVRTPASWDYASRKLQSAFG